MFKSSEQYLTNGRKLSLFAAHVEVQGDVQIRSWPQDKKAVDRDGEGHPGIPGTNGNDGRPAECGGNACSGTPGAAGINGLPGRPGADSGDFHITIRAMYGRSGGPGGKLVFVTDGGTGGEGQKGGQGGQGGAGGNGSDASCPNSLGEHGVHGSHGGHGAPGGAGGKGGRGGNGGDAGDISYNKEMELMRLKGRVEFWASGGATSAGAQGGHGGKGGKAGTGGAGKDCVPWGRFNDGQPGAGGPDRSGEIKPSDGPGSGGARGVIECRACPAK